MSNKDKGTQRCEQIGLNVTREAKWTQLCATSDERNTLLRSWGFFPSFWNSSLFSHLSLTVGALHWGIVKQQRLPWMEWHFSFYHNVRAKLSFHLSFRLDDDSRCIRNYSSSLLLYFIVFLPLEKRLPHPHWLSVLPQQKIRISFLSFF